jgi:hypothetical protein
MIVTNAGRDAVDADAPITNGAEADGKNVWSWHPDAGIKFALGSAGDGGKRARSPGSNCVLRRPVTGRPQGWRWRAPAFGG